MKKNKSNEEGYLKRYTQLHYLLEILIKKRITLLNPSSWEDKNDLQLLEQYQKEKKFKSVFALCFTEKSATYHHWKVFAGGSDGVCIEFNKTKLLKYFKKNHGFTYDKVRYYFVRDSLDSEKTQFAKLKPFEDDHEFRIVYGSKNKKESCKYIKIDLDCINRVTLSPWMPSTCASVLKQLLKSIKDCHNLKICESTLTHNSIWSKAASKSKTRNRTG